MSQNLRSICSELFFFMKSKNSLGVIPHFLSKTHSATARMEKRHPCTKPVHSEGPGSPTLAQKTRGNPDSGTKGVRRRSKFARGVPRRRSEAYTPSAQSATMDGP